MGNTTVNVICSIIIGLLYRYLYAAVASVFYLLGGPK